MPGGFPLGLELCNPSTSSVADVRGVNVIPSATANTKGSYVTLIAATSSDVCWMIVGFNNTSTNPACCDIAIGPAGSERIIAPNLIIPISDSTRNLWLYSFPCAIPDGTRISARTQSAGASITSLWVNVLVFDGAFTQMEGAAGVDVIGFTVASTVGTTVTGSATANAKGAYAQLIAATTRDYMGLIVTALSTTTPNTGMLDIATGAGGSERIIISNLPFLISAPVTGGSASVSGPQTIFTPVPAGTRLSARIADFGGGSIAYNVTIYGIYQ